MTYVVDLQKITKTFPGVIANSNVTLSIEKGEIHALVGENGAGKTTLMNILYGLQQPDSGGIFLNGKPVSIRNPQEAIALGIGMVHQHFMLVPSLTVLENIIMGKEITRYSLIDYRKAKKLINEISLRFGIDTDPSKKIFDLSVGEMQRVEILKALYRGADILILDEPTSVLTPQEIDKLFSVLREFTKQGKSVIFITHKLKEVLAISDRVTVMRNGKVTGNVSSKETDEKQLARMMVGREVIFKYDKQQSDLKENVLQVRNLSAVDERGLRALKEVSFSIRLGEIVGIAGVEGNGQNELVEVITGLKKSVAGSINLFGKEIGNYSTRRRRELGISHIPGDRMLMGINKSCTIEENLILNRYYQPPLAKNYFLNSRKINEFSNSLIKRFNVATPNSKVQAGSLSGGNIQKLILAREMEGSPDLLIACQPTRGIDIGAIEYIHSQIIELRNQSHGVLLVSSELEEIMDLSDRILVIYQGEIVGEFNAGNVSETELGLYMAGVKRMDISEDGNSFSKLKISART